MSITPSGQYKSQINQGGLKNQSIFDNDLFGKLALRSTEPPALVTDEPADTSVNNVDPRLQDVMNNSNSLSMNNPANEEIDSDTQADFSVIAKELTQFLAGSAALSGKYVLTNQAMDQRTGKWTFTIEPADRPEMSGPMVTKGN